MAYNLIMGVKEEYRKEGITQLLLWEAIKKAKEKCPQFNFEGSMLLNIEPVFRRFGGKQKAYNIIYKDSNKFISLIRLLTGKLKIR